MKKRICQLSIVNCQLSVKQGFTLIELLVTMALLGTLATIAFSLINPVSQLQRSRDLQRKNDLAQLQRVLEQYYNDVDSYPTYSTTPPPDNYNIKDKSGTTFPWNGPWAGYTSLLPRDPSSTQRYIYYSPADGQSYFIYAHLERGAKDSQVCNPDGNSGTDDACINVPSGVTCGTAADICNFGVGSQNFSP